VLLSFILKHRTEKREKNDSKHVFKICSVVPSALFFPDGFQFSLTHNFNIQSIHIYLDLGVESEVCLVESN